MMRFTAYNFDPLVKALAEAHAKRLEHEGQGKMQVVYVDSYSDSMCKGEYIVKRAVDYLAGNR